LKIDPLNDESNPLEIIVPQKPNTPKIIVESIKEALEGNVMSGPLCGYPLTNLKVEVLDYSYDPQMIDDVVYKIAANNALRTALNKAKPVLMEPIMNVEIVVPNEY